MLAKIVLKKGDKEIAKEIADIVESKDLEAAVGRIFATARQQGHDLWNINLEVTKA